MKCLRRNKTDFEYLPYNGVMTDLNDNGEHTGEFHPVYMDPVPMRGNISAPSGRVNQMFFGQDIRYTHTLVMDNPNTEINERGLIRWKGELYDIVAARPSLNFISFALKRQTADDNESEDAGETDSAEEPDGDGE